MGFLVNRNHLLSPTASKNFVLIQNASRNLFLQDIYCRSPAAAGFILTRIWLAGNFFKKAHPPPSSKIRLLASKTVNISFSRAAGQGGGGGGYEPSPIFLEL